MGLIHTSLKDYYALISSLQINNYRISDIEKMIPYERDLYAEMLNNHLGARAENNG